MQSKYLAPLITLALSPTIALAAEEHKPPDASPTERRGKIYNTPREKREAGLGTKLTDWLTFSGLIELEATSTKNSFRAAGKDRRIDETVSTVQLGFKAEFSDQVEAEMVLEFEDRKTDSNLDEAFIELKKNGWSFAAGRQTLPFGAYYSHFITGPFLEFGETRKNTFLVGYDHEDKVELSLFVFDGDAREVGDEDRVRDWGAAVESKLLDDRLLLGASYISDLAESDERLLKDFNDRYLRRVGAWSAYAVARPGDWELSLEALKAVDSFRELDANADRPGAWNLEVAYYPSAAWEVSLRYERSEEFEDEPERRYGIGATWLAYRNVTFGFEWLRGKYKRGFVIDDDGNQFARQDVVAAQLSLLF